MLLELIRVLSEPVLPLEQIIAQCGSFTGKVFITENDCIIKQTIPFQKQKMPEDIETADKLIKTVDCLLIEVIFFRSS